MPKAQGSKPTMKKMIEEALYEVSKNDPYSYFSGQRLKAEVSRLFECDATQGPSKERFNRAIADLVEAKRLIQKKKSYTLSNEAFDEYAPSGGEEEAPAAVAVNATPKTRTKTSAPSSSKTSSAPKKKKKE